MNKVVLLGRICHDLELKYVGEKNSPIVSFSLAVRRDYKNSCGEYDTDFIDCDLWGKKAETFCKYLNKGDLVGIEGKFRLHKYTSQDNKVHSKIIVFVESFSLLPSSKKINSNNIFNNTFNEDSLDYEVLESELPF